MANVTGLITVNGKQILEVDDDPSLTPGTPAPIGSLAMYDDGAAGYVYLKTGANDEDWSLMDADNQDWNLFGNNLTGGAPATPDQYFGSNNDYDVIFKRNTTELARLVSQGLLIGLNASAGGRLQVESSALAADLFRQQSPNGGSGSKVIMVTRQYKVQTTDGVATTLADVAVPTDSVVGILARVVGRQHGGTAGAAGDGAYYLRNIHARNIGGTVSVRQTETIGTSEDDKDFNVTVAASTSNVRLQVEGETDRNIAWFGHVELMIAVN